MARRSTLIVMHMYTIFTRLQFHYLSGVMYHFLFSFVNEILSSSYLSQWFFLGKHQNRLHRFCALSCTVQIPVTQPTFGTYDFRKPSDLCFQMGGYLKQITEKERQKEAYNVFFFLLPERIALVLLGVVILTSLLSYYQEGVSEKVMNSFKVRICYFRSPPPKKIKCLCMLKKD